MCLRIQSFHIILHLNHLNYINIAIDSSLYSISINSISNRRFKFQINGRNIKPADFDKNAVDFVDCCLIRINCCHSWCIVHVSTVQTLANEQLYLVHCIKGLIGQSDKNRLRKNPNYFSFRIDKNFLEHTTKWIIEIGLRAWHWPKQQWHDEHTKMGTFDEVVYLCSTLLVVIKLTFAFTEFVERLIAMIC